jgi:hypothetical protein
MPEATALWLIDNTSLTFDQIAEFCGLHKIEVKAIADGDIFNNMIPTNPITKMQLTKEEIKRCQNDSSASLKLHDSDIDKVASKLLFKKARYVPIARRRDKPDAIFWLIKNFPEMRDSVISKLTGSSKPTIEAIRNGSHWNMQNITPKDPVLLGICSQALLDNAKKT